MRIEQLMSMPAITCSMHDTLSHPAQLMWENDIGVVQVVNADGRLAGVVTDRDISMAAYTRGQPLDTIPVTTAMSSQVFSCHPDDSVETAERIMREKQIRRIPIVNGEGCPLGLISVNDIARHTARDKKAHGAEHEFVQALAAICQPRGPASASATKPALAVSSEQAAVAAL